MELTIEVVCREVRQLRGASVSFIELPAAPSTTMERTAIIVQAFMSAGETKVVLECKQYNEKSMQLLLISR